MGWGAAWLYKATNNESYWNYVQYTINNLPKYIKVMNTDGTLSYRDNFAEFGWDTKVAGINVLVSGVIKHIGQHPFSFFFTLNLLPA